MKAKKHIIRKLKNVQALTPLLIVGILVAAGAVIYNFNAHAASGGFTFQPESTSVNVGDSVNVAIYEDSGTDCTNVVQADISYPASMLRYDSFSATGSKLDQTASSRNSSGQLSIVQYTTRKECGTSGTATSGVSGKQLIGTLSFTATGAGQASLSFQNSSIAVSASDNKTDVAPGTDSTTIAIAANSGTNPTPTPPAPAPAPPHNVSPPSLSVTLPDSDQPVTVNDNGSFEVTDPVDINPQPIQPDGVNRIEYSLNGKLVATVKTAPYTYHLDTRDLLNGTYTLTTKTYYENGQTKTVSQKVIVHNPASFTQFKLWLKKYAWLIVLLLLVFGAIVAAWFIHRKGGTGSTNYYGDKTLNNTSDYMVTGNNDVVTPDTPDGEEPQVYHPTGQPPEK